MVLPSWVTMYGILLAPTFLPTTLQSLNLASSGFKLFNTNLPLESNKTLKFSLVFWRERTSMIPQGNLGSLLNLLSILTFPSLSLTMVLTSLVTKAYLNLCWIKMDNGMDSLNL